MAKKNKYLDFISDELLLTAVGNLHQSYEKAKADISKKKFYSNKIDTFKMTFDSKFNNIEEEKIIEVEILRQIDKSINNSIGTFHEEILGGINGFEKGNLSGYDIKATNDTLFADIKNKHNTMNSSAAESLFQKLAHLADSNKKANCYWVQILAKNSFVEPWFGEINGKEYSHSRVFKISGDKFYTLLTGIDDAFFRLYKILPTVISDFMAGLPSSSQENSQSAINEIKTLSADSGRGVIDQISFENYSYYLGFDKL